jgi:hypothetical protein
MQLENITSYKRTGLLYSFMSVISQGRREMAQS